jgi:antitoxin (DNA-binding transcriptional repressor) of toxin-antitoxin stability system
MTEQLAHRDLRNRSSEILREVASGATFEITNHGKVVAVLSPPPGSRGLRVRAARVRGRFAELPLVSREESVQDALDDLRGDR